MNNKSISKEINIADFFKDPMFISNIIQNGINEALLMHKQAGNPVCTWKDGKVVWIPAEDIQINFKDVKKDSAYSNNEMHYVNSAENIGIKKAKLEGQQELFNMLLTSKFGNISAAYLTKISGATPAEIQELCKKILITNNIDELFN